MKRAFAAMMVASVCTSPVWAAATFDADVTPDAIFGSGNANGLFTVDRTNGVELGLRAKIPFVGTINSNGDGTYSYALAELFAANPSQRWNFDWTVNTDYLDSSGDKIDDFTYLLEMDFDPSQGTVFLAFDPVTPSVYPFFFPVWDHSIGDNTTGNGLGVETGDPGVYATRLATKNVLQQSWRHAFFPFQPCLTYDPTIDGTYDVVLIAFSGSLRVASTRIQVIVGAGGGLATDFCGDGDCCASAGEDNCSCPSDCGSAIACDDPAAGAACEGGDCNSVPAVSEWGLSIMVLLGLSTGTILYGRRRTARN